MHTFLTISCIRTLLAVVLVTIVFLSSLPPLFAQEAEVEQYYRPFTTSELDLHMEPSDKDQDRDFFRDCPDEINIGGVDADVPIFGNVDVDVNIGRDVVINCGAF